MKEKNSIFYLFCSVNIKSLEYMYMKQNTAFNFFLVFEVKKLRSLFRKCTLKVTLF